MPKKQQGHCDYYDPITHNHLNLPKDREEKNGEYWEYLATAERQHLPKSLISEEWDYNQRGSTLFQAYLFSKVKLNLSQIIQLIKEKEVRWYQSAPYHPDDEGNIPIINDGNECYQITGAKKDRNDFSIGERFWVDYYDPKQDKNGIDPLLEEVNHSRRPL